MFDIYDPTNLQNKKKDHHSRFIRTRDKKGHVQSHATLTYRVTLSVYSDVVYLFEILDPQNMQNKKKFIALAFLTSRYIPKCHVFNILTFRGCQDDVIWRHMTSSIITLTILDSVWHISRKSHQRILRYSHFPQDSDQKYASGGRKIPPWALWVLIHDMAYYDTSIIYSII